MFKCEMAVHLSSFACSFVGNIVTRIFLLYIYIYLYSEIFVINPSSFVDSFVGNYHGAWKAISSSLYFWDNGKFSWQRSNPNKNNQYYAIFNYENQTALKVHLQYGVQCLDWVPSKHNGTYGVNLWKQRLG